MLCVFHTVASSENILHNSSTLSQPGSWHWYSSLTLFTFYWFYMHLCVFSTVTCVHSCDQCHTEGTEQSQHKGLPCRPRVATPTSFLPLHPWKPLIFLVTITVPFTECHTVGIIQYVKTLLLRNVFRFLHIFSWLESSFLSSAEKNSCLDVPPFMYTFTCWRTFWLLPSFGNYE